MENIALLAGGTGLVGSACLQLLLQDEYFSEVKVLVRKSTGIVHHKLIEVVVDFDNLNDFRLQLGATHVFCALGTTIKKAGSQDAFRKVDYDYPLELAKITHAMGAKNYTIVTAMGASASSPIFYNKVKGELQESLKKVGFDSLNILQPSLLMGNRAEERLGEGIAQSFFKITGPLWIGPLKKYAGIESAQVARAMLSYAKAGKSGINIFTSDVLQEVK